ncbi:RagB/SusD family nutrient uptake outer membrane protein [Neolewinella aurantiaca]|uniref:RagB/SusD family nutrient uptake outer membrane protein n=1 Tax=Neolewinella aurantiaca TaxID=2602767 RepID=A0A5C7FTL9_9BACT|nr:RagB/SusD family nutrient uptake outer membrane protein [Neolewinella aurantiaca]TXF88781.1 RagB/SusD family nutrient uptake outer membrane protein [Neolewinella aurantiaca]
MKFTHALRVTFPALLLLFSLLSCEIEEQFDPNGPSINSVLSNATPSELNLLVTGIEARTRDGFSNYVTASGTIARELYIFDADPRNTSDLLGKDETFIDANTFYLTAPFSSRYRVVKNANVLLEAVNNTTLISADEADGYRGFANTMKALMLSQVLDLLNENGIRVDVADPENLGPFLSKEASYDAILALYDEAFTQLQGSTFNFTLSSGFTGFDTPEEFAKVNRALSARTATHAERYQEALTRVNASFLDLNGDLSSGPEHIFGTGSGDILNPLFKAPGQSGDQLIVHPRIIANATSGDARLGKFRMRVSSSSVDGLTGDFETALYESVTSPIDIIRNEELVLIWAEASINTGEYDDGVTGINIIRNAAGIGDYSGDVSEDALIDEMLYQRTYSLWGEGHQMFDLRRYGLLNADYLPIDRVGDDVFTQFPIPLSEGQ